MQITTDRLLLREYVEDDWRAMQAYQSDPRYLRYYAWTHRPEADVREFVGRFIAAQAEQPRRRFALAVVLKAENRLIGNCNLRKDHAADQVAEIGYELNPDYWGCGYATEAVRALLAFGFDELKLHRIAAWCIAENVASARVLEKLGMTREGRLREREWIKGRWWDALLYSILDREWPRGA
ncbi:MAG: GNAT family N-acetyltransferase [Chloroflexi bacterium]|nr:GNAT family N-acetyltransferase [Chloroflexota bacterium]